MPVRENTSKIEDNVIKTRQEKRKNPLIYYRDALIFIVLTSSFFVYTGSIMGIDNLFSTLFNTAYGLLIDTVFYVMAIAVLAGAFGKMAAKLKVIELLNIVFAPLMKPLYNLPGVSFLGIVTTYLSDNPAIISLAREKDYLSYFKYEAGSKEYFFVGTLSAILEGGQQGVEVGLKIIPGVLVICTIVMILTFGQAEPGLRVSGSSL